MAVTYNWTLVRPLVCSPSFTDPATGTVYVNVVVDVHWRCDATDGTNNASRYGTVHIPWDRTTAFTPFASLTKAIVADWVQGALNGVNGPTIAQIRTALAAQLAAMASPRNVQLDVPAT